ncbi:GDP dissociation inhibitor-domain-containing protein [Mycena pura]|uniref:Rab proteins geranylgeranyltransferase n=1 Tax=Mycena pura TaxID=153505 RepID=A0AAD6YUT1_9AGAR|nr:GDP dissociation inhibitor-domain-containing protein [Mycena pura]
MDDEGAFDIIIVGTGLTESITAAALAKAGFRVAHIDENAHYGSSQASLTFDELIQWQVAPPRGFSSFFCSGGNIAQPRTYSISLSPSLIPSKGPLIEALVASGVAKYGGFRLVERVFVYDPSGTAKPVPGSKEDVFKNKDISLIEKRRLMRFLQFAAGDFENKTELKNHADSPFPEYLKTVFSLNDEMTNAIAYALAYCLSPTDTTLAALHRLRRYLLSAGRYGASPFLVGHYGSSGEIAQGFCRTAAVSGAVYILGKNIESVTTPSTSKHIIRLQDFAEPLSCSLFISSNAQSASLVPFPASPSLPFSASSSEYTVARCIAIIDRPLCLGVVPPTEDVPACEDPSDKPPPPPPALDTAVIVFPPLSLVTGGSSTAAATVLLTGEGTMSCPKGKWILYIALPLITTVETDPHPQTLLKPYLDATLALAVPGSESDDSPLAPLFSLFYLQHHDHSAPTGDGSAPPALAPVPLPPVLPLPDAGDAAAVQAEGVFWEAMKVLRRTGCEEDGITSFWPLMERDEDDED